MNSSPSIPDIIITIIATMSLLVGAGFCLLNLKIGLPFVGTTLVCIIIQVIRYLPKKKKAPLLNSEFADL